MWVISRHALWHDMVRRQQGTFPNVVCNSGFVNRKCECLTNVDVVKWLYQIVHGVIVDPQLSHLMQVWMAVAKRYCRNWHARRIDATCLIVLISCSHLSIKRKDHSGELRVRTIVVRIG